MALLSSVVPAKPFNVHDYSDLALKTPAVPCCSEILCEKHSKDVLYRKPLKVCWSLSKAQEFDGKLPAPSQRTKDVILAEACLWLDRDRRPEWERFKP